MLGTIGGVALLIGTGGLFYLKLRMDVEPATPRALGMDVSFNRKLSFLAGYQYNPSTNDMMSRQSEESKDYHSVTAGLYFKGRAVKTGFGVYYNKGSGDRVINDSLDVRPIEDFQLGILLTTSIYY